MTDAPLTEVITEAEAVKRELGSAERPIKTLLAATMRQLARGRRARHGSHERARCAGSAQLLRACAAQIVADKPLRAHLEEQGLLDAGWRRLAVEIERYVHEKQEERK